MSDATNDAISEVARRIGGFAGEMREQGIHVGMRVNVAGLPGGEVRCVACDEIWPCSTATPGPGGAT